MKSSPAWMPRVLRSQPALLVEWLRLVNSLSRWREDGRRVAVLGLSAIAIAAALFTELLGRVVATVGVLAQYWVLLAVVATVFAATTVSRRRRHIEESQSQSWLIATPIPPSSVRVSHAIRTLFPLIVTLLALALLAGLIVVANDGVSRTAATVFGAAAGGVFVGGVAGWWMSRKPERSAVTASRYVPRPRTSGPLRPDAAALGHWPISQVLSWSRPENSRYVLIAALLAVQGGSSAVAGLSVMLMYFVASYLAALLSAMTTVAKSAATWLRATPMTLGEFVWGLSRRALVHQVAGTALAAAFLLLLGSPLSAALQIAGMWLGLVLSISGFALVENYRGRSPFVKITLSVAAFAALAMVLQLRGGARA